MLETYCKRIGVIFDRNHNKHQAMAGTLPVLEEMARDATVVTDALRLHLSRPGALAKRHYPVIAIELTSNPHYSFIMHCWMPLPDGATNIATKAIHHHGDMLLNTATAFGPGYEHWTFTMPERIAPDSDRFTMRLRERGPHPLHHMAFVDGFTPHVPFFPASLTITLALWTSRKPMSWRDTVKRMPLVKGHENTLRKVAAAAGLKRALDLKVVEDFDYLPDDQGFRGLPERDEFPLGPNRDYLQSLFHLVKQTGNATLVPQLLDAAGKTELENRPFFDQLLRQLGSSEAILPRLSEGHFGTAANFTTNQLERALDAVSKTQAAGA